MGCSTGVALNKFIIAKAVYGSLREIYILILKKLVPTSLEKTRNIIVFIIYVNYPSHKNKS